MGNENYMYDLGGYGSGSSGDYSADYLSPAEVEALYGSQPANFYTNYDVPSYSAYAPDSNSDFITQGEADALYGPQPEGFYQEPGMLDKALGFLGSKSGQGLLSLGLGGLSLYGNYLANKSSRDQQKAQTQLLQRNQQLESGNDFAKMHALAQIIQARQGINLDPSLAYAQAVRDKMGLSPKNATQFPGVDIGGPMHVGASSQEKLGALNTALGYNFASGGGVPDCGCGGSPMQGALGLLRGGSTGQADDIQANLSGGEYVFDADTVSALGDGNTEAGAARLDHMREMIRKHKRSAPIDKIPPPAHDPMKYLGSK